MINLVLSSIVLSLIVLERENHQGLWPYPDFIASLANPFASKTSLHWLLNLFVCFLLYHLTCFIV